jgi:hypothetical protein
MNYEPSDPFAAERAEVDRENAEAALSTNEVDPEHYE